MAGKRLEYPRGPEGVTTWMVTTAPDGTVRTIEQVLTAENFQRVRPGMSQDGIRRMLGKPTKVEAFALKQEEVWGYPLAGVARGPGVLQRPLQQPGRG